MSDWVVDLVVEPDTDVATLVLSGESDPTRVSEVVAAFAELFRSDCTQLRVDLSEVTLIDQGTLEALLEAHASFDSGGRPLGLVSPSLGVRRAFLAHPSARHLLD